MFERMVRENEFAAPSSHDFEMILANQIFELLEVWLVGHQIVARRVEPKALKSGIVNEDVRSARCIRTVLQIEVTPIQNQDVARYIKRYGRQSPVIMVHDHLSIRRSLEHFRQWPRRQKWIEHHQCEASGVVEQDHHQPGCQERPHINPPEGCQGTCQQRDRCDSQGKAQIGQ